MNSTSILREFFHALGITKAPAKPIEPPECGYHEFGRRMANLAKAMEHYDRIKAMG